MTASLLMPDTGSNYAAFWVQHPNGIDPREIDVIESYGPLKPAGAQFASHICYDDTPETAVNACAATGRGPGTGPVATLPRRREAVERVLGVRRRVHRRRRHGAVRGEDGRGNQAYA